MAIGYTHSRKYNLTHSGPLRFREDGTFKILHLTDIHKVHPDMDDDTDRSIPERNSNNTLNCIRYCIEKTEPDLVVFGGDNVSGHWDEMTNEYAVWCLEKITEAVKEKNIPLAVVFGNHDAQNEHIVPLLSREIQMSEYMNYANFRGCFNEADVYGCGNYHLPILPINGEIPLWNIWCFDSNDYIRNEDYSPKIDGYDTVHKDQIEWYEETVKDEKEKYGKTVPSLVFQHIPVLQEYDFIELCDEKDSMYEAGNMFYRAKEGAIKEGLLREGPCPPMFDGSEFEAWVRSGDVKAAFFGHDHTNSFRFDKDGISLYQTIGVGFETYGKERGGRIITLHTDETFETETVVYKNSKE